jgi:hypothetical protein
MDFGFLLSPSAAWEGNNSIRDNFMMDIVMAPWLSLAIDSRTDLYFSAGLTQRLEDYKGVDEESWWLQNRFDPDIGYWWVFELYRAEIDHRLADGSRVRLGRIAHSDPLGFVFSGLFDGLTYTHELGKGTLGAGVWYTGTQFKKTANITMTVDDTLKYYGEIDFEDLTNSYFSSQRLLGSLWYEYPELPGGMRLNAAFLHQSDLNPQILKQEYRLHSQYLIARFTRPLGRIWTATGGFALELEERDRVRTAAAAELGFSVYPSQTRRDQLSFTGRYSTNGADNSNIAAFAPITTSPQGYVLRARLSGISLIEAAYTSRVTDTLTLEGAAAVFFKSSNASVENAYFMMAPGDWFLGADVYLRGIWAPFSDLMLSASLGTFKPAMFSPYIWKFNLAASLAVY